MRNSIATTAAAALFVALGAGTANAAGNLIVNGGFDSGFSSWSTFTTGNGSLGPSPTFPRVVSFDTTGSGASAAANFQVGEVRFTSLLEGGGISQSFTVGAAGTYNLSVDLASFDSGLNNASGGVFSMIVDGSSLSSWNSGFINSGQTLRMSLVTTDVLSSGAHTFSLLVERPFLHGVVGQTPFQYIDNVSVTAAAAVPEPETYAMLVAGLGLLGFAARRRKLKHAAA